MTEPQRIVIVGAGVSGLATAFALTDPQINPGWKERYTVDVYQMGWRVGGKCATGRDADHHDRIHEHGIHVFGNMYFNSLRMVKAVQDEVEWDDHDRFRTMDTAFLPSVITLNTEWMDGEWHNYLGRFPLSDGVPWDGPVWPDLQQLIQGSLSMVNQGLADALEGRRAPDENAWERVKSAVGHWLGDLLEELVEEISERLIADEHAADPSAADDDIVMRLINKLVGLMESHTRRNPHDVDLHMKFTQIDLVATALRGMLADDVIANGIDSIDDENYRDWLARHGMSDITLAAGLPQGFPNTALSYEYGDTTAIPTMSAAAWLTFFLRQVGGTGAGAYFFAEGTGETVMKPLFRLLEQRGVTFHFFHKLTQVTPDPAEPVIRSLAFDVQATVKGGSRYDPLRRLADGELVWPDRPNFDQLVEGDALRDRRIDLESWWTPWQAVDQRVLAQGVDFDQVVLATPIATLPHTCAAILDHPAAKGAWGPMVANVKTAATQAVQIWLDTTTEALGWPPDRVVPTDRYVGGFFAQDLTSFCDFSDLVAQERWPSDNTPKGLIYFIGALADPEEIPPFTDHDYPQRADERVKWSTIQYLRTINGLLPHAAHSPIDARSFDFDLLSATHPERRGRGINQFDQQYWRANIDPNERYTLTVKGSVKHRLHPWDSKFDNLVLAGDWTYTGFNIGSFEGAVMSGKLASLALTGAPSLDQVWGYGFLHPDAAGPTHVRLRGSVPPDA